MATDSFLARLKAYVRDNVLDESLIVPGMTVAAFQGDPNDPDSTMILLFSEEVIHFDRTTRILTVMADCAGEPEEEELSPQAALSQHITLTVGGDRQTLVDGSAYTEWLNNELTS